MIKAAIVDDDNDALERIREYLARFSRENGVEIIATEFKNAIDFLEQSHSFDLVFLDIEMPLLDGMHAAEKLRETNENIGLIFVTNSAQYAIRGYSVNAIDYLLKPVLYARFSALMKKTMHKLCKNIEEDITLRTSGGVRRVPQSSIMYVEVSEHLIVWHTENGDLETWGTLKEAEKMLPSDRFVRCSHSCIVSLRYVVSISGESAILSDGTHLVVSHSKKKTLADKFVAFHREG